MDSNAQLLQKCFKLLSETLRRRMSEYGITQKMFQSTITEFELDDKVSPSDWL